MELKSVRMALDSTSFNFITNTGAQIGFIASESQPFCGQCSRWRLSADGILRACLLKDDGLNIKNLTPEERILTFQKVLGLKPSMRPSEVAHSMNTIGG
jgi:cyclic pyranopterin phosphate synthase